MKRTFFLKLGPPHSESCEELHKEKKSRFGMTSILCIKKGAQRARARQQNLDNEYKQLKQRTRSTGEAGIQKIKEGFPYFYVFDEVMGHRDSIDPSKMAIEGSSTFT